MAENVLLELQAGKLDAFHDAIGSWIQSIEANKDTPRELALTVREAEGVVAAALEIPSVVKALWESTLDLIRLGGVDDYRHAGEKLLKSLEQGLLIVRQVHELTRTITAAGRSIRGADELPEAIRQLEALQRQIVAFWPTERVPLTDVLREHAQGNCVELTEAFAAIAGISKAEWIERVAAHERGALQ